MEKILEIAKREMLARGKDVGAYHLEIARPKQQNPDQWLVIFDLPHTEDARVEMVIDARAGQVVDYRDEWA